MKKSLLLGTIAVISCCNSSLVNAQEYEFLNYVESDAVFAGEIRNINLILDEITNIERFRNNYTDAVASLLFDRDNGLVPENQREELWDSLFELERALRNCGEVFFVVHELTDSHIAVSLALRRKHGKDQADFGNSIGLANAALTRILDEVEQLLKTKVPSRLSLNELGDWFILSNDSNAVAELITKLSSDGSNNRAMSDSRKYKRAVAALDKRNDSFCIASFFGNPAKLRRAFGDIDDKKWASYRIEELPSFGAKVYLLPEYNGQVESDLWLAVEATISKTYPACGIGKYWNSLIPLNKVPNLRQDALSFRFEAFDPESRLEANDELTQLEKGVAYLDDLKMQFSSDVWGDVEQSICLRCDSRFSITYRDDDTYEGLHTLRFEHVYSQDGFGMYFKGRVTSNNESYSSRVQQFEEVDIGEGQFQAKINCEDKSRKFAEAIYLDQGYFISGRLADVSSFVKSGSGYDSIRWDHVCPEQFDGIGRYFSFGTNVGFAEIKNWEISLEHVSLREDEVIKKICSNDPNESFKKVIVAKENEFGVRFRVHDENTRREALRIAIEKAVVKILGNRVVFIENDNERVRLLGGLFR